MTRGVAAEESSLVASARRGDRIAFAVLVDRHLGWVRALCARMLREPELADDAARPTADADQLTERRADLLRQWSRRDGSVR